MGVTVKRRVRVVFKVGKIVRFFGTRTICERCVTSYCTSCLCERVESLKLALKREGEGSLCGILMGH